MKNNNGNHEMNLDQVIALIRRIIRENKWTITIAAEQWGVSKSTLSEILNGKHKPGKDILDALDLEHIDKYRFRKRGE